MNTIDLTPLSKQDLKSLQQDITNRLFELEHLPDNLNDLYPNLSFKGIEDIDEWLCYEEGYAKRVLWSYKDDKPLHIDIIEHSAKHTYTKTFRIAYDGKTWLYSDGTYATTNVNDLYLEDFLALFGIDEQSKDTYTLENVLCLFDTLSGEYGDLYDDETFHEYLIDEYGFTPLN